MEISKIRPRIGKKLKKIARGLILYSLSAMAQSASIHFFASTDAQRIAMGESVILTLTMKSEGGASEGEPSFDAPDFDVGQQSSSISMSSQYDSSTGQMATVTEKSIQVLLHPRKQGQFRISQLQMKSGGQVFKTPDILVLVGPPGSSQLGSQLSQRGLNRFQFRGGNLRPRRDGSPAGSKILVKAEVDRAAAFKGQKVIVSYYLYHQPKVFNVQMDQFPVLTGFLREDLDSVALGQSLETQEVKLNGEAFERSLLARYAAYPVSEGQLTIDPVTVKYQYLDNRRRDALGLGEDGDPFFGFFHQMTPKVGSGKSEPLTILVSPLPQAGRPADFSGGVGEFNLLAMVDKYEVRANEAMTLTLKVEGTGNLTSLQAPQAKWPSTVELYDTHGRALPSRGGGGAKVFEFLLIPRSPGSLTLPPLQLSFFDPEKKIYYSRSTEPIEIRVLDPLPGSTQSSQTPAGVASSEQTRFKSEESAPVQSLRKDSVRDWLKPEKSSIDGVGLPIWRYLYWASLLALIYFVGRVISDWIRGKAKSSSTVILRWTQLQSMSSETIAKAQFQELVGHYETLSDALLQTVDDVYSTSARSTSRSDLQSILMKTAGFSQVLWGRISRVLEFADLVRFAGSSGVVSEDQVRSRLSEMISEAQKMIREMQDSQRSRKKKKF
jgi:hypothetical protein